MGKRQNRIPRLFGEFGSQSYFTGSGRRLFPALKIGKPTWAEKQAAPRRVTLARVGCNPYLIESSSHPVNSASSHSYSFSITVREANPRTMNWLCMNLVESKWIGRRLIISPALSGRGPETV